MNQTIKALRGMHDILPEQMPIWHHLEKACSLVARQYGFDEIRTPALESSALFKRSIGDVTDIIEKEMYTFSDRNGDSLSLRPEGTASCVRAGIQNALLYNQVRRLWYCGPMYRHERPQKGRYRQFYQWGVEIFGIENPAVDVEIIAMSARLWRELGLVDQLTLQINTIGTLQERAAYQKILVDYLQEHFNSLDEDSKKRLGSNPLRILDSKCPKTQAIIASAPTLMDSLGQDSLTHFQSVLGGLDALDVAYVVNPCLVRGLDYYQHTVFEWVSDALGAQATVCAGGRYDGLVGLLGGKDTPAVGLAMGMERIVLLLESLSQWSDYADIYIVGQCETVHADLLSLAELIRDNHPSLKVLVDHKGGSLKNQLKRADKSCANWAVLVDEQWKTSKTVTLKNLKQRVDQQVLNFDALSSFFVNEVEVK